MSFLIGPSVFGQDSEVELIPVAKVWSNRIPDTRDIFELEPAAPAELMKYPREFRDYRNRGGTLTQQIVKRLGPVRLREFSRGAPTRLETFAVLGKGDKALREAHKVLVGGAEPRREFAPNDEITLVFFVHLSPWCVHIKSIEQARGKITISYQFVPNQGPDELQIACQRVFLALIPTKSLRPGKQSVEINRLPSDRPEIEAELVRPGDDFHAVEYAVSGPCHFEIKEIEL
jgi:hypothetical protein